MFVGEWMEQRGIRDQIVLATKVSHLTLLLRLSLPLMRLYQQYTSNFKRGEPHSFGQKVHFTGNNVKSMHISVEASLAKLRTSYIDILYVHWWDWNTSVEEVMNSLHNLVVSGKVLHLVRCGLRTVYASAHRGYRAYRTPRRGLYRRRTCTLG